MPYYFRQKNDPRRCRFCCNCCPGMRGCGVCCRFWAGPCHPGVLKIKNNSYLFLPFKTSLYSIYDGWKIWICSPHVVFSVNFIQTLHYMSTDTPVYDYGCIHFDLLSINISTFNKCCTSPVYFAVWISSQLSCKILHSHTTIYRCEQICLFSFIEGSSTMYFLCTQFHFTTTIK